jgi:hypothetical protein
MPAAIGFVSPCALRYGSQRPQAGRCAFIKERRWKRGDRADRVTSARVRPIAIGVFRRDGCLLVGHAFDSHRSEHYCRPPGGGIDFDERAEDALRRELREELGAEIAAARDRFRLRGVFRRPEGRHYVLFLRVFELFASWCVNVSSPHRVRSGVSLRCCEYPSCVRAFVVDLRCYAVRNRIP